MKRFFKKLSAIGRNISELHIAVYAGNAVFFIVLSLLPATMVLLAAVQHLPATVSDLQNLLEGITPSPIHPLLEAVISGIPVAGSVTILSVSAVGTLWSVTRAMMSIMNGLDAVYRSPRQRPYVQKVAISFLSAVVLFVSILATLLLQVFGDTLYGLAWENGWDYDSVLLSVLRLRWVFTFAFLTLVFCLFYTVLPYRRQGFMQNMPGAVLATLGWLGYSLLFGFYVENFSRYANLYGSLTAVVITLLWLYFCLNLIFYGGLFNYILKEVPHPVKQLRNYFRH